MYKWPFLFLTTAVTYVLVYFWWIRRRARALCKNLPKWPEIPLLGNVLQLSADGRVLFRRIQQISEKSEEANLMFQIWFGPKLVLVMSKPEDVKIVTNYFIEKPYYYNFGEKYLGEGLVTASDLASPKVSQHFTVAPNDTSEFCARLGIFFIIGDVWKRNIKKLSGTFSTSIVDGFQEVFNAKAWELVERMSKEVGQEPFDPLHKYLAETTLGSVCQTALGAPDIAEKISSADYYAAFNRVLELLVLRGFNLFLHPEFIYRLTPSYREFTKCVNQLHYVSKTVINRKRNELKERKKPPNNESPETEKLKSKFRSFIDILMEMSESDPTLSDEQIRAEVDTIILGGQETSATTMLIALIMLGSHDDVQKKLREEVIQIFGDSKRPAEKEDLAKMKYCEAVIMEVLRLYPPIPAVARNATSDLTLSDGQVVPDKTVCIINAWGAGRSKRSWGPDALEFRPERWLDSKLGDPAIFLPFSYGRRSCIGKRYATAILKTLISTLVRNFRFKSNANEMEFKLDLALRLVKGNLVTVHKWD